MHATSRDEVIVRGVLLDAHARETHGREKSRGRAGRTGASRRCSLLQPHSSSPSTLPRERRENQDLCQRAMAAASTPSPLRERADNSGALLVPQASRRRSWSRRLSSAVPTSAQHHRPGADVEALDCFSRKRGGALFRGPFGQTFCHQVQACMGVFRAYGRWSPVPAPVGSRSSSTRCEVRDGG